MQIDNKRLGIIFVITTVDGYGADKSILENIIYLNRKNLINCLIIIPKKGNIEFILKKENINYKIIKFYSWTKGPTLSKLNIIKRNLKYILNSIQVIKLKHELKRDKNKFKIVHTNTFTSNFGILLAQKARLKHIMHLREIPYEQFRFEFEYSDEKLFKWVGKNSSKIFSNSDYTSDYFKYKFLDKEIITIPNPIFETDSNYDLINPSKKSNCSKIKFVILGRYEDAKNQFDALNAAKLLVNEDIKSFELHLYGNGPLEDDYKKFIKENNLSGHIFINGFDKDIKQKLSLFHVGIVTSRYEAFGRVTVEYLAQGLPVIGNNTGNTPYLVMDNQNGYIYTYKNAFSLASQMKKLIDDPQLIYNLAKNAQRNLDIKYSIKNSSEILFKHFSTL